MPVPGLACVTADGNHRHIALCRETEEFLPVQFQLTCGGSMIEGAGHIIGPTRIMKLQMSVVKPVQVGIQAEPGPFQPLFQAHHIGSVHLSGTGSSGNEAIRCIPVQVNLFHVFQRKNTFIFQEHHPLGGGLPGNGGMAFQIGGIGGLPALESPGLQYQFQHPAHAKVQIGFRKRTGAYFLHDFLNLGLVAGHHQVVPGAHLGGRVAAGGPVREHDAPEAPFVAEDSLQQSRVFLGPDSVDAVVRAHDGPWLRFPHRHLEALEIDFP